METLWLICAITVSALLYMLGSPAAAFWSHAQALLKPLNRFKDVWHFLPCLKVGHDIAIGCMVHQVLCLDAMQGRIAQQRLKVLLDKYLLRRTKEGTLKDQLPRKTDNIVLCPMSELQLRAYRSVP